VKGCSGTLYAVKADVSKEEEIVAAFKWVKNNLGGVDVLINNAGISGKSTLHGKRHEVLIYPHLCWDVVLRTKILNQKSKVNFPVEALHSTQCET